MRRYRNNIKAAIVHDSWRWGNRPEFRIEAHQTKEDIVGIEMDRSEALKLRKMLNAYIKLTCPPPRRRK